MDLFLPAEQIDDIDGFAVKLGKKHYYFRGGETPFNDSCSANIALNKYCMNKILESQGIPVPKAIALHRSELEDGELKEKIADLKFPLVAKPTKNGSRGRDVLCNIQTLEQLTNYLNYAFTLYEFITIEEFHGKLKSYRVLVFNRQVIGVIQRYPAQVVGDGKHSLAQLVQSTNLQRAKLNDALGDIVIDEECRIKLQELKLDLDYIPQQDEQVFLAYTSNATRGGTFKSLGKQICKKNSLLLIRAAQALNLNIVGIDVECEDINVPMEGSRGVIIEMNNCPSIKIHEIPMSGPPNRVSKKIMRSFIYRHPLSYLAMLYINKRANFYIRGFVLAIFLGFILSYLYNLT
ncbi:MULTISPECIES: UDP-N-acetylmuramyl peptide synthase [Legionella]|uniref:UDP-N-acetylmuramyl tripeptide synthase n=1 Tax=Legionella drozanskii LLAP-1 TaxID=1212489 RepID=A0A0W0SVK0_9GAMM|nr:MULTISPECIES: UDP-N-acetylmuramyl peptide synthase [Legionella]KTC87400.1 UDP-N-acetylmuramyl tripeptide synthase [Legionella drozanskii LLAP-1]PJE08517.1 MAG: UDP-N-acetylmuramyl peptide synthase [Legionella sp.]